MSKTLLTFITAAGLSLLSVALIFGRWYVLGPEIDGTPGNAVWRVTMEVEGELTATDATVTTLLAPDFRHQHIIDETFESKDLSCKVRRTRDTGPRRAVWSRRSRGPHAQPFRLVYSFRCVIGMRRPTFGMVQRSHVLDAAPPERGGRRQAPGGGEHAEITAVASRLAATDDEEGRVRAYYDFVASLGTGPAADALTCLREEGGTEAGKARLLAALCRSQKIPSRLLGGLVLEDDGSQKLHLWTEAWVDGRWLPLDPADHRFGAAQFEDYLVLRLGDELVRARGARVSTTFTATDLHNSLASTATPAPTLAKRVWRKMSLANLRPEEQVWVKFLLLLPVAALVVCAFRTVIGITTFGTFGPALLGLVCRDPKELPGVLGVFMAIMMTGWGLRHVLDRYHLLVVPRMSALLTVVVMLLLVGAMLLGPYTEATHGYVALLPLIILTHMIERFWTVEAEDSTRASFQTLLGTAAVAVSVALVVNFDLPVNAVARLLKHGPVVPRDVVRATLFRYPEALGLVLACQLMLGRYTGYRLTELFRFRDLLLEEPSPPEDKHEPASASRPTAGDGHPGHEPAEHGVYPRPQSEGALPTGGRQEADA
jgi:uncharacterized membrane protein